MPKKKERLSKVEADEKLQQLIPEILDLELTLKQVRFLHEYIVNDMRAGKAYKACTAKNITDASANALGCAMLQHPKIVDALKLYTCALIGADKQILEHKILNQLMVRAFYSPYAILTDDLSELRPKDEIPEELHQCIISVKRVYHPKDTDIISYDIKLADRDKARSELIKYSNMMRSESGEAEVVTKEHEDKLKTLQARIAEKTGPTMLSVGTTTSKPIKKD